jgi:ribosomal-protein-alanine N-acetyltransferase
MRLRQARTSDVKMLFALEHRLFSEANYPLSRRSFYYHIRHNLLYLAVSESEEIMGYLLVLTHYRHLKIYSLGVDKAYRKHGVATALLKHFLISPQALDCERVMLEVRCDNTSAIALYEQFGFKAVKTLTSFYKDGCDGYLMSFSRVSS